MTGPERDLTDEELEELLDEQTWHVPVQGPERQTARHLDVPGRDLTLAQAKRAMGYYRAVAQERRGHVRTLLELYDSVAGELHELKVWAGEEEDPQAEETRLLLRRQLGEDRTVRRLLGEETAAG